MPNRPVNVQLPHNAEDATGDPPLAEPARQLRRAKFFVKLFSGLAWLARAAGTLMLLISSFTQPTNELATPYRVINWHACRSCRNDPRERFDHKNFLWCLHHVMRPRHFDCTRQIIAEAVIGTCARVLGHLAPPADSASGAQHS